MAEFQPTPLRNFSGKLLDEFFKCLSIYRLESEELLRIRLPVLGSSSSNSPEFQPGRITKPAVITPAVITPADRAPNSTLSNAATSCKHGDSQNQNTLLQDALEEWFECESSGKAFSSANFWQSTARKTLKHDAFCTDFRMRVWQEIAAVPRGQVRSYGEIAQRIGSKSPRAVGSACGANPWPLLIPCHRVVASGGLGGFSGDLGVKLWLLQAESR